MVNQLCMKFVASYEGYCICSHSLLADSTAKLTSFQLKIITWSIFKYVHKSRYVVIQYNLAILVLLSLFVYLHKHRYAIWAC